MRVIQYHLTGNSIIFNSKLTERFTEATTWMNFGSKRKGFSALFPPLLVCELNSNLMRLISVIISDYWGLIQAHLLAYHVAVKLTSSKVTWWINRWIKSFIWTHYEPFNLIEQIIQFTLTFKWSLIICIII